MNLREILRNSKHPQFLSLAGNGAAAVMGVLSYFLLYHFLPENDMGNFIFFQTLFALADALRTGFLQTALVKFYAGAVTIRQREVAGSTWHLAILISIFISIPAISAGYAESFHDDGIIPVFIKWYGFTFLITCPFNVTTWILQAEQRFDRLLILRLINQGLFILSLLFVYYFNRIEIRNVIYCYAFSSFLSSLFPVLAGWSKINTYTKKTVMCTREFIRFGRYSVGTYLCSTVFKYSDLLIIKFFIGPAALAIYNLSQRLLEIVEIVMRSFIATAMPAMSMAFNRSDHQSVANIMKKYTGILTVALIPVIITVILFADSIVMFVGGPKYAETPAAGILRIFMFSAILFPLDRFSGITLDIIHKPHLNLLKVIFSLLINIAGDLIAIRLVGGLYGIAIASIFTLLFGAAFGYIQLNRFMPIRLGRILKLGYTESLSIVSNIFRKRPVL